MRILEGNDFWEIGNNSNSDEANVKVNGSVSEMGAADKEKDELLEEIKKLKENQMDMERRIVELEGTSRGKRATIIPMMGECRFNGLHFSLLW